MWQAGFIAAGGKYALQNNVSKLNHDRDKAIQIESTLQSCEWVDHVIPVETNIVIFILKEKNKRDLLIDYLENKGILSIPFGDGMIRLVTHIDLTEDHINYTCDVIKKATI
jgi:threonine aldolase